MEAEPGICTVNDTSLKKFVYNRWQFQNASEAGYPDQKRLQALI
jgi:hypothetical protein